MSSLDLEDFRAALREGRLAMVVCGKCKSHQPFPCDTCYECGSDDLTIGSHAGNGRVLTWTVAHYAFSPEFEKEVPYTVVLVELEGGGRVYGRLTGTEQPPKVEAEMPVALDVETTRQRGFPVYRRR